MGVVRYKDSGRRRGAHFALQLQDAALRVKLPADRVKLPAFGGELAFACLERVRAAGKIGIRGI